MIHMRAWLSCRNIMLSQRRQQEDCTSSGCVYMSISTQNYSERTQPGSLRAGTVVGRLEMLPVLIIEMTL